MGKHDEQDTEQRRCNRTNKQTKSEEKHKAYPQEESGDSGEVINAGETREDRTDNRAGGKTTKATTDTKRKQIH